ncbi:MAG: hypothetical protein IIB87_07015 [Chloroflexi bacterium]|nr:hypothetical protein [Chloroflexota bacterium]
MEDSDTSPLATSVEDSNTSPLATWNPSNDDIFNDATTGEGTLDISAACVRLIQNQKTILLVWPEPTSWNASSQVIEFVGPLGERAELRDGDQIMPGGVTVIGGGNIGEPDIGAPPFVSPPDPSCKAEETFIVNSLVLVTD